jgi:hypothetical protein
VKIFRKLSRPYKLISELKEKGYSDAYVEAVVYGRFKSSFSIKSIAEMIELYNDLNKKES